MVASFDDGRIHWHNLDRNYGSQWAANNYGLTHAAADWVAYLGHDDIWYPTHLEAVLRTAAATGAELVTSVMILYGPPDSGIRALAGVVCGGVSLDRDFVPPSALAHTTALTNKIGFWQQPDSVPSPVDVAYLGAAAAAHVQVASTRELTVFKFNAAWRRDAYKLKSTIEQRALLERIHSGKDVRHDELLGALYARAADKLMDITLADMSARTAAQVHHANRVFKGVEPQFAASDVRQLATTERFYLSDTSAVFEWHLEETDEQFGSFRWSGPSARSSMDLPVSLSGDVAIRIHILHAMAPDAIDALSVSVNARPASCQVERLAGGTFLLHGVARADDPVRDEHGARITLDVASVQRPIDLGINTDRRWLGVAVNWIEVEPIRQAADAT